MFQSGRSRGFAFVYFKNIDDAIEVCIALHLALITFLLKGGRILFCCLLVCLPVRSSFHLSRGVEIVKLSTCPNGHNVLVQRKFYLSDSTD